MHYQLFVSQVLEIMDIQLAVITLQTRRDTQELSVRKHMHIHTHAYHGTDMDVQASDAGSGSNFGNKVSVKLFVQDLEGRHRV